MKDGFYLVGFLALAALLLFIGKDQLPLSNLLTWGVTFGATTASAVLLVSLYRLQLQLKVSRHELARKDAEIGFARQVQQALFPRDLPSDRGLEISAICIPAQGISGDYYDVIACSHGSLYLALADISGKGVSAAILMSNLQANLRAQVETGRTVGEVCSRLNNHLHDVTEPNRFATLFLAQWFPADRRLEYVNAGHHSPILAGSKDGSKLEEGGPPIGLFGGVNYMSGSTGFEPSDLIVLYSDGITETVNDQNEEFGEARLTETVAQNSPSALGSIQRTILDELKSWSSGEAEDDMTLMIMRVTN